MEEDVGTDDVAQILLVVALHLGLFVGSAFFLHGLIESAVRRGVRRALRDVPVEVSRRTPVMDDQGPAPGR